MQRRHDWIIYIAVALVSVLLGGVVTSMLLFGVGINQAVLSPAQYKSWEELRKISEVAGLIEQHAYNAVDAETISEYAVRGALQAVQDDYATYYTETEYAEMVKRQAGEFYGLGVVLALTDGGYKIDRVYDGSPAAAAGILAGDYLLEIDGTVLEGMALEDVSLLLQGEKDKRAQLKLRRGGELVEVTSALDVVYTPKVNAGMMGSVLYVQLVDFNGDCLAEMERTMKKEWEPRPAGVIVDLRDNLGGDLQNLRGIADMFLDEGAILLVRPRTGEQIEYAAKDGKVGLPLAVLVNGNSASASEVLAGAVQDHGEGVIIGEVTYGKGIMQSFFTLNNGGGHVRLTTSQFFTPDGHAIHGMGIAPDYTVSLPEAWQGVYAGSIPAEEDAQLQKALDVLGEQIAASTSPTLASPAGAGESRSE